ASQPSIVLTGVSQAAAPSFMKGDQPTKADEADGSVAHDRSAGEAGVIAASNAAARVDRTEATRTAEPATAPEVKPKPSSMVDLLWFDPALADRIRGYSPWADALKDAPKKREWVTNADAVKAKEQKTDPARPVARAMTRVPPLDLSALGAVVADSVDEDGLLARPLLVLDGELEVTFDPVDVLRASASTARLFASADKRLKEAVDAAVELAEPDRPVTLPILEGALNRLRQAFAQANRSLAPTYLETSVERSLLERRKWAEREVLGGTHLVARAFSASGASAIAYLPVAIRARLPLVPRVRVRMIAEPHLFQEPDSEQIVLLTLALARTAELAR
ncbi:MAG: hypothetical protein U0271_24630, partial [Polyangiaceae bacterium]